MTQHSYSSRAGSQTIYFIHAPRTVMVALVQVDLAGVADAGLGLPVEVELGVADSRDGALAKDPLRALTTREQDDEDY